MDVQFLGNIGFLARLPRPVVKDIAAKAKPKTYPEGAVIVEANTPSTDAFLVLKGTVRAINRLDKDNDITLGSMGPGDLFGELSAIDHQPRSATVVALTECEIAAISSEDLRSFVLASPEFAMRLIERFAGMIRTLDRRLGDLTVLTPEQRVYAELIRMAQNGTRDGGSWAIHEMPGHEDIAGLAGTSRDVVARAIGNLARVGVVERKHKTLYVRDPSRLSLMARPSQDM